MYTHPTQTKPYILCLFCRFTDFSKGAKPVYTCKQKNAGEAKDCFKFERDPGSD